jgi:hypothetical protein
MTLENVEDDYDFRQLRYEVEDLNRIVKKLTKEIEVLKNAK